MIGIPKGVSAALLLAALAACGSGLNSGGSTGSTSSSGGGGSTVGTSLVELGSGVGTAFKNQTLALQVSNLSAGGSTDVTANIVDANNSNALYTQSVTVTFTSNCASAGTANLTSSVTTTNGAAIATYIAQGCSGKDTITASTAVGSTNLTASAIITVQPPTIGTVQFISATPSAISLKGVGGNTSSKVIFQVNDADGNPLQDATVDFTPSTTAGGITLSPASAVTDSNGQAATFVEAGTVHTSVNVTATVVNTSISQTTPNAIAISTGIPVQTRFSLALGTHNVSLSFDHDGIQNTVSVFAVDRYGNPASPGTNILFTTNSGVIFGTCPGSTIASTACGSCQTDATGACSVTWESEGNRPITDSLNVLGHAHILAYTVGEEFYDESSNDGVFSTGDSFTLCNCTLTATAQGDTFYNGTTLPGDQAPAFNDIGDPYMDSKETGYFIKDEVFEDINSSVTTRRVPNGEWYGAGCGGFGTTTTSVSATNGPGGSAITVPCANTLTMIGKDDCIVMSTDGAIINGITAGETITTGGTAVTFTITDLNGNAIGSGSTVAIVPVNVTGATLTLAPAPDGITYTQADQGCSAAPALTFTVTSTASTGPIAGSFHIVYTSTSAAKIGATTVQSLPVTVQ